MGRYPFLTYLGQFSSEVRPFYASTTFKHLERKLRYIHRIFQALKAQGRVATTNPRAFGQLEIGAFIDWMNARYGFRPSPLSARTQAKMLEHLDAFLGYLGNGVIQQMKARRVLRIPRSSGGPLPSPSEEEVGEIITRLQGAAPGGEEKALGVLGVALLCAYAGARPKEARLSNIGDLSTGDWVLMVVHPKGEGSWASPERAKLIAPGRQAILSYLELRAADLQRHGIQDRRDIPLVPYFGRGAGISHWPEVQLRNAKCHLEHRLGIRFNFQMLRRAFGQNTLDKGASIEHVSVALRHSTTKTTETYYCRRRVSEAFDELERVWSSP